MEPRTRPSLATRTSANACNSVVQILEQTKLITEQLERGQSQTPMLQTLQKIANQFDSSNARVSILCLSEATLTIAKSHLDLDQEQTPDVSVTIALLNDLALNSEVSTSFFNGTSILFVLGEPQKTLCDQERELVKSLAKGCIVVLPLVIHANQMETDPSLSLAWPSIFESIAPGVFLEPLILSKGSEPEQSAASPIPLGDSLLQRLCKPISAVQVSDDVRLFLELLLDRCRLEAQYSGQSQQRLEKQVRGLASRATGEIDRDFTPLREEIALQLATVEKQLTLKSDRSTQPLGELSGLMRGIASSLNIEDLETTRTSATLKLSVNSRHLAGINRRIEHALRTTFFVDAQHTIQAVELATSQVINALSARMDAPVPLKMPTLDSVHAWRSVENLMAVGKESHFELARKGFFDVLTAGRQKVFIIIMFLSLMGRMGLPNLFATPASKTVFGLFLAAIMVSSMISAVIHWRREKQSQSEKELTKIREALLAEGTKVVEQVEKAKLVAIREYLKESSRTLEQFIKSACEEATLRLRCKREIEQTRIEVARKSLEQRQKLLSETEQRCRTLLEQTKPMVTNAIQTLRTSVQHFPSHPTAPNASIIQSITTSHQNSDASSEKMLQGPLLSPSRDSSMGSSSRGEKIALRSVSSSLAERRALRALVKDSPVPRKTTSEPV